MFSAGLFLLLPTNLLSQQVFYCSFPTIECLYLQPVQSYKGLPNWLWFLLRFTRAKLSASKISSPRPTLAKSTQKVVSPYLFCKRSCMYTTESSASNSTFLAWPPGLECASHFSLTYHSDTGGGEVLLSTCATYLFNTGYSRLGELCNYLLNSISPAKMPSCSGVADDDLTLSSKKRKRGLFKDAIPQLCAVEHPEFRIKRLKHLQEGWINGWNCAVDKLTCEFCNICSSAGFSPEQLRKLVEHLCDGMHTDDLPQLGPGVQLCDLIAVWRAMWPRGEESIPFDWQYEGMNNDEGTHGDDEH
jgi:hypothetical protein